MNPSQLQALKELLVSFGFDIKEEEQRITNFDNDVKKGEVVITFQARFQYAVSLKKEEK